MKSVDGESNLTSTLAMHRIEHLVYQGDSSCSSEPQVNGLMVWWIVKQVSCGVT